VDTAPSAAAAQSPPRPAEWSRALEPAPRQTSRGLARNARTALSKAELSRVEMSIGGGLPPDSREDAIGKARLGKGLESALNDTDRGGETACYAHLVCPECGAVLDGGAHASGCSGKG
jgi:hypothetical protein